MLVPGLHTAAMIFPDATGALAEFDFLPPVARKSKTAIAAPLMQFSMLRLRAAVAPRTFISRFLNVPSRGGGGACMSVCRSRSLVCQSSGVRCTKVQQPALSNRRESKTHLTRGYINKPQFI